MISGRPLRGHMEETCLRHQKDARLSWLLTINGFILPYRKVIVYLLRKKVCVSYIIFGEVYLVNWRNIYIFRCPNIIYNTLALFKNIMTMSLLTTCGLPSKVAELAFWSKKMRCSETYENKILRFLILQKWWIYFSWKKFVDNFFLQFF